MTVPHGTPDLAALIERLEYVNHGSRALDRELHLRFGGTASGNAPPFPLRYTTSIDDALTLVPKEGAWHVSIWSDGEVIVRNEAWADAGFADGASDDSGKTPALALCIAALKARMAT